MQKPFTLNPVPLTQFVVFSLFSCPPNYLWQSWLEKTFPGYTHPAESGTTTSIAQDPMVQSLNEKAAPALRVINDTTAAATTALSDNEIIQNIKNRATDGVETVKAKAMEIDIRAGTNVAKTTASKGSNGGAKAQPFSTADGQVIEKKAPFETRGTRKDTAPKKLNVKNTAIKFALDQTIGAVANTVLFIAGISALRGQPLEQIISNVKSDSLTLLFAGQKLWPAVSIISFTMVPLEHRTVFGGMVGVGWNVFLNLLVGKKK